MNKDNFSLRHSFQPYFSYTLIFALVSIFALFTAFRVNDWGGVWAMCAAWVIFYLPWVYLGLRYKIAWRNGVIKQKASGLPDREIKVENITQIKRETSDAATLVSFSRPFRRIVVYEGDKYIDVSLKHFKLEDIVLLLHKIKEKRPDISIPSI